MMWRFVTVLTAMCGGMKVGEEPPLCCTLLFRFERSCSRFGHDRFVLLGSSGLSLQDTSTGLDECLWFDASKHVKEMESVMNSWTGFSNSNPQKDMCVTILSFFEFF